MKAVAFALLLRLSFALVCSLILPAYAFAADYVTVRLFSSERLLPRITFLAPAAIRIGQTELSVSTSFSITTMGNALVLESKDHIRGRRLAFRSCIITPVTQSPMPISIHLPHHSVHQYLGQFKLSFVNHSTIKVLNYVSKRDYVNAVVAGEAPPGSPMEMLKAQAILVQTLLSRRNLNNPIDDSTQLERYAGYAPERPEVAQAVAAVWGSRIYYHHQPIQVYFHSTCAGATSAAAEYFHLPYGSLPYLTSVGCNYCKASPFHAEKQTTLPASVANSLFHGAPPTVLTLDKAGRPLVIGMGRLKVSGYNYWIHFGQTFGWDKMPGTRFRIEAQPNGQTTFYSSGAGHGVGFCQWGAIGLARAGRTYRQILKYYFPTCEVLP